MSSVYHKSDNKMAHVHFMVQDWPDDMKISKEAFAEYAKRIEEEDFEDDIRNLSSSLHLLVGARRETIKKLRASAEYLDSVWVRCRITKSVGTSASVVGGSLTIAGGILTLTTAGLAAPLLIAGIATSSVGAATNIGTSVIERIINSKQVKEMGEALTRDKELTLKIESQIEAMRRYKDSGNLDCLLIMAEDRLGRDHILVAILNGVFSSDTSRVAGISSKFISEDVHAKLTSVNETRIISNGIEENVVLSATDIENKTATTLEEHEAVDVTDMPESKKDILVTQADQPNITITSDIGTTVDIPMNQKNTDISVPKGDKFHSSWTKLISDHCKSENLSNLGSSTGSGDTAGENQEESKVSFLLNQRSQSCSDVTDLFDALNIDFDGQAISVPDNLGALNVPVIKDDIEKHLRGSVSVCENGINKCKSVKQGSCSDTLRTSHDEDSKSLCNQSIREEIVTNHLSKSCDNLSSLDFNSNTTIDDTQTSKKDTQETLNVTEISAESASHIHQSKSDTNLIKSNPEAARLAASAATTATAAAAAGAKQAAKDGLRYNPLSPDVFYETGKVVGQNSTRLAGQVIVGVSAAFLAWDVIDLGWTVADLIRKKGSNAGKILKDKADELDGALKETIENYSVEMMWD